MKKYVELIKKAWLPNTIHRPTKNRPALHIIKQIADLFSPGSSYYFIMNFENLCIDYVDPAIENVLGYSPADFNIEMIFDIIHPDDLKQVYKKEEAAVNFILNEIAPQDILSYKVIYTLRLRDKQGHYRTILQQSQALSISEDGKAQHVLGIHTDVSYLNLPVDHRVTFLSNSKPSFHAEISDPHRLIPLNAATKIFTRRETEIIKLISKGKTVPEIAQILNVSPHTIHSHRKNILNKSGCHTAAEVVARCIREGLI